MNVVILYSKYQVSLHRLESGRIFLAMKGAPERIVAHCNTIFSSTTNGPVPMTEAHRATFEANNAALARRGERVLGFCMLELDSELYPPTYEFQTSPLNFPIDGLCYVGLIGLVDPPRPTVPNAVACCRDAGIAVIMVTGDHPITARAIAAQVGIIARHKTVEMIAEETGCNVEDVNPAAAGAIVVTGSQLLNMSKYPLLLAK